MAIVFKRELRLRAATKNPRIYRYRYQHSVLLCLLPAYMYYVVHGYGEYNIRTYYIRTYM